MRVVCASMESFLANLEVSKLDLFQNRIFVEKASKEVNEVKEEIILQASTVVRTQDGDEFLIQLGMSCGFDYNDASGEKGGTKVYCDKHRVLKLWCDSCGITLMPGFVDY